MADTAYGDTVAPPTEGTSATESSISPGSQELYDLHKCAEFDKALARLRPEDRKHLSLYLNMILAREKHNFSKARNNRPFSLLELSLCVHMGSSKREFGLVTEPSPFEVSSTIEDTEEQIRKELGKFILLLRTTTDDLKQLCYNHNFEEVEFPVDIGYEDRRYLQDPDQVAAYDDAEKEIHQAAMTEVILAHPADLRWYLKNTQQGKKLLEEDDDDELCLKESSRVRRELRDLRKTEPGPAIERISSRLQWLLNASLYEHTLLMPKAMRKHADEGPLGNSEPPEAPTVLSRTKDTANKTFHKISGWVGGSSAASSSSAGPDTQRAEERTFNPYQEHLKLAKTLPGLENAREEELFPKIPWRAEYSMDEKLWRTRQVLKRPGVRGRCELCTASGVV
ncbi:hypothetical protein B0T20DRAFT_473822 [Sordaria brevicollis]|uniref:Uncharacterized protein n=1 Tax=Sordaria brevicollis TaxID=83679 RepID=A0AAE0NV55_SORBR|nr:hypothetical protein B0T20DRAFT_473822 [Sordaria brevicollis]